MVRLGDPFFAAFLPVFDVTNQMIGLGLSARAKTDVSVSKATTPEETTSTRVEELITQ